MFPSDLPVFISLVLGIVALGWASRLKVNTPGTGATSDSYPAATRLSGQAPPLRPPFHARYDMNPPPGAKNAGVAVCAAAELVYILPR